MVLFEAYILSGVHIYVDSTDAKYDCAMCWTCICALDGNKLTHS